MPLTLWAAQTMAASNLLGVGEHTSTFTCYISPTFAASSIQQAYRLYLIWQNCHILPCLRGPYKSWPSSNVATEEWAAKLNASYCSTLASMYRQWAPFTLADLVLYFSNLLSQDVTRWPPLSSDWDTLQQEYDTRTSSFDSPLGLILCNTAGSSFLDMLRDTCFLTFFFFFMSSFLKPFWWKLVFVSLFFWLIVGLYIAVLLHPVPRVVHLGFSLHPSFYTSILAPQYESVWGGDVIW
jgi:hypothetical protein